MKNLGKKALEIIKGIAPIAASAIGGPFGGAAVSIISKALGVKEQDVDSFVLSASPDDLLKLRLAEIEFDKWCSEAGIRHEELSVKDRDSARNLAIQKGILIQATLSVLYTVGYFYTLFVFLLGHAKVESSYESMVIALIGSLGAVQIQVLNFWFGSSSGSKEKSAMISAKN